MQNNLLAIDPGLHSAGWAAFKSGACVPHDAGLIVPRHEYEGEELLTRSLDIGMQMASLAKMQSCSTTIIEFPAYYGEGDKHAGQIFKLCACIGAIAGCLNANGVTVESVLVPDWKGQLPKIVVQKRIERILGLPLCRQLELRKDMWDAVGIGLYKRGMFK
ncbi:MAG: hypothetical protein AAB927_02655 [Patescibacteria group bacterium]